VKIEDHIAAHKAGVIGPDGKRRDRTVDERRRWSARYNGTAATERYRLARKVFVPRADYERVLRLPPVDYKTLKKQVDDALEQET
jgi:hypothetical protein